MRSTIFVFLTIFLPSTFAQEVDNSAVIDCLNAVRDAELACDPRSMRGQDQVANQMSANVGAVGESGMQLAQQTQNLSYQVYETAMTMAENCHGQIIACENMCPPDDNTKLSFDHCHGVLREQYAAMKASANAAVIAQGQSAAAMNQMAGADSFDVAAAPKPAPTGDVGDEIRSLRPHGDPNKANPRTPRSKTRPPYCAKSPWLEGC